MGVLLELAKAEVASSRYEPTSKVKNYEKWTMQT